jgi:hypothetical protein
MLDNLKSLTASLEKQMLKMGRNSGKPTAEKI